MLSRLLIIFFNFNIKRLAPSLSKSLEDNLNLYAEAIKEEKERVIGY